MIGNCLENALDAAKTTVSSGNAFIRVRGKWVEHYYIFSVQNSYLHLPRKSGDVFFSTKHSGCAIGLKEHRSIADKYHGQMSVDYHDSIFQISIALAPLHENTR